MVLTRSRGPILIIVLLFSGLICGCSDDPSPAANSQSVNAEPAAEIHIAEITDANFALTEGSRLLDENQTEKAIDFLERAISLDPDLAEGHFKLGIAYALLELQYEQEGVLTETSNNSDSKKKSRSEGSFERAVKAYEKWLDAHPDDHNAYYFLGRTFSKLMKDEEAEKAFKQAVKLQSEDTEYQTELGAILVKLAKYHEAIVPLKKAIELDPENVRAEELLEDAEAGRKRIDYVSKPDSNSNKPTQKANSSTTIDSNSDTPSRPSVSNARPVSNVPQKPAPIPTRSN